MVDRLVLRLRNAHPGPPRTGRCRASIMPATANPHLLPQTPLPSGWAVEPVSGNCVRLSDGARFGRATSLAMAWSMRDIHERLPGATGLPADLARLRNAIGCAAAGNPFGAGKAVDAMAAVAVHAAGDKLTEDAAGRWSWQPDHPLDAAFNERLACFMDTLGAERASHPALREPWGETRLLTGCVGRLAVRSEVVTRGAADVCIRVRAQACGDAASALQCARGWVIAAARAYLTESAQVALGLIHRLPFHEHDSACVQLVQRINRAMTGLAAARDGEQMEDEQDEQRNLA